MLTEGAARENSSAEATIAVHWMKTLRLSSPPASDLNFFEAGGTSVQAAQLIYLLNGDLHSNLSLRAFYDCPTPSGIRKLLAERAARIPVPAHAHHSDIAIVGAACRLPGAGNLEEFWELLRDGRETIRLLRPLSDKSGEAHFVPAIAQLDDIDLFDAEYFGFSPTEARLVDPQIRMLLECCATALRHAGYAPVASARIALYAGGSSNGYLLNILESPVISTTSPFQIAISNDRDALTTIISHRLNLTGPSVAVQTFCSTSLVAVHLAKQSLLAGECEMALAGGVSLNLLSREGYDYQPGGVYSPDGHCRPFDATAGGTIFGEGVGVVALKRMQDALDAGDKILAIIKGSAINNDGGVKGSYAAPGVDGQTRVILEALSDAGVDARSISYVEAHGTATALGDPIEVQALTRAFRATTDQKQFCGIGSVKSNFGHLDRAAGVSSLIKVVLALQHKEVPATLNYHSPNPDIDFQQSPFFVNSELRPWRQENGPRRAAVTALGIGGTNAHIILEEAPEPAPLPSSAEWHLLPISANSEAALSAMSNGIAHALGQKPGTSIADLAFTLQSISAPRTTRRSIVCADGTDAQSLLRVFAEATPSLRYPHTVLLFPGQGVQHFGMGLGLYKHSTMFREAFEQCLGYLGQSLRDEIRRIVVSESNGASFQPTELVQPALFAVEYATAKLMFQFGIAPHAMIGHSVGEFVAATLSGVMTLEDAARLVAERGRLMQTVPPGSMLAVQCEEAKVQQWFDRGISVAAVNGESRVVLSGPSEVIAQIREECGQQAIPASVLRTSHAFHSSMMDAILPEFRGLLGSVTLNPPRLPLYSSVTGQLMPPEQAQSADYWAEHLRATVRFSDCLSNAATSGRAVFLDVGPGNTMAAMARAYSPFVCAIAPGSQQKDSSADKQLLETVGKLWCLGVPVDWAPLDDGKRLRVNLPSYPFERQRHWIERESGQSGLSFLAGHERGTHCYVRGWKRASRPEGASETRAWIVFIRESDDRIAQALAARGHRVIRIYPGDVFEAFATDRYRVRPDFGDDFRRLFSAEPAARIAYGWASCVRTPEEALQFGFHTLHAMLKALSDLSDQSRSAVEVNLICEQVFSVNGKEQVNPFPAVLLGISQVAAKEVEHLSIRTIEFHESDASVLAEELDGLCAPAVIALRGRYRWVPDYQPCLLPTTQAPRLREHGVYWITGGTGGIGLSIAKYLAKHYRARLVLTQRTPLPPKDEWTELVRSQPEAGASRVLRGLLELEEAGANVLALCADVTDAVAMTAVARAAKAEFGTINGAIHAAGIAGGGLLYLKPRHQAEAVIAPKLKGAVILRNVLAEYDLDFLSFCSSIASVTGDFGQADYCAANSFLDAFAVSLHQSGLFAQSVNWGPWREVGMAVNTEVPAQWREAKEGLGRYGIDPAAGVEAFDLCLRIREPQVVVAAADLNLFVAGAEKVNVRTLKTIAAQAADTTAKTRQDRALPVYENATQRMLAGIFEKTLSIEDIGLDDNFFHLGGNSLLALQMLPDLKRAFDGRIGSANLFEYQTIRGLAEYVERGSASDGQEARDRGARVRERRNRLRESNP